MIRNKVTEYDLIVFNKRLNDVMDMSYVSKTTSSRRVQELLNVNKNTFQKVLLHYKESLDHIPGVNDFLSFEVSKSKAPKKMHLLSHILGGKFIKSGDKGFSRENCRKLVDHIDYMNDVFKDTLFFSSDQTQIKVTRIWQKKESIPATWCIG